MKVSSTAVFYLLSLVKSVWNLEAITSGEDVFLASALTAIIDTFYVRESNNIFVTTAKDVAAHNSILENVFSALDANTSITWILHDQDYLNGNINRLSSIILIDSYRSFRSIFKSITTTSLERFGYYTIVLTSQSDRQNQYIDLANIFLDFWHNNIVNVNILTYSNATRPLILVQTYFPFAPSHCGKIVPVIWNTFHNGHFVEANKPVFPLKTENLFRCPISILVSPIRPYIFTTGNNSDGSYNFDGIEYLLLLELSKQLNFKLNVSIYWERYLGEFYGFNGSAGGAFGMILERMYDVLIGALIYEPYLKRIISSTRGYLHDDLILVVPNPRHYSSFETLFFPFTATAWSQLTVTLLIAVTMIKLLRRIGKRYYKFVVGSTNTAPYLNLLSVLLTSVPLHKPKENFARFLLMVWLLSCFVLQTIYQGQLFYFIKTNKMVPSAKSIDELIEKGISIKLVNDNFATFLIFDERLKKMLKPVDPISDWEYVTETEGYITFGIQLNDETQRKSDELLFAFKPKTVKIASYVHIFDLSKRFYLKEEMDDKIIYMNENGLMTKWSAPFSDASMAMYVERNVPRQLNISQILGVVQVWFGSLILATILFMFEILSSYVVINTRRIYPVP